MASLRSNSQRIQKLIDNPDAKRKRTELEHELDLLKTAELYVKGWRQDQIADYISEHRPYKLSSSAISLDIKILHERWVHAQLINMDEAKARELSKIDKVETAAWEAWEKTLTDDVITESTRIEDNAAAVRNPKATTYTRGRVNKRTQTGRGDAKYLDIVLKCVNQRCRILGVYAPDKIDVSWRDEALKAGLDPEQVHNELVEQFVGAAKLGGTGGSGSVEG